MARPHKEDDAHGFYRRSEAIVEHWQSHVATDKGRRQEVLIPPKGAFATVLYSKAHGDLLVSGDVRPAVAFNFTARKALSEKT